MKPYSNLDLMLRDGYSLWFDSAGHPSQEVVISVQQIGEINLTSGRIIACDPFLGPDVHYSLRKEVTPGRYPVFGSVARFPADGAARFACAQLRFGDAPAVRWEIAEMNKPAGDTREDADFYGVDAGTGCFFDHDASEVIAGMISPEIKHPEKDEFEHFCDKVVAEMEKNYFGKYPGIAGWADIRFEGRTEANLIAFSSGWGDGGYSSFWGYDADGNLTSLVTDFELFPNDEPGTQGSVSDRGSKIGHRMVINDTTRVEIPLSRKKILLLIAGAVLMTAGSVFLWTIAEEQRRIPPGAARIVSVLGAILFGAAAVYGAVKMFDTKPGLVLDAEGLIDNSSAIAAGRIPWEEIIDIQTMSVSGQSFISIIVKDPEKYIARGNPAKRMLARANFKGYGTPIFISSMSLGMKLPELEEAVYRMFRKHRQNTGGRAV